MKDGRFREDLYFRIKVVTVRLPPLRERRDDIPLLVERFVREFAEVHGRPVSGVTAAAMQRLLAFSWPGNVRQLRNAIETCVLVTPGPVIDVANLPPDVIAATASLPVETRPAAGDAAAAMTETAPAGSFAAPVMTGGAPATAEERLEGLVLPMEEVERILIRNALRAYGGNREHAARALGISERTLYRKIKQWGPRVTS